MYRFCRSVTTTGSTTSSLEALRKLGGSWAGAERRAGVATAARIANRANAVEHIARSILPIRAIQPLLPLPPIVASCDRTTPPCGNGGRRDRQPATDRSTVHRAAADSPFAAAID